jgi:hypothetical protein
MDFNRFDSRTAADQGRDLHLRHPVTGEPLSDEGKPCIAIVRGSEGREVQAEMAKLRAAKMEAEGEDKAATSVDGAHKALVEAARVLIVGFKNVNRGKSPAKVPEDVDWFLNLQMATGRRNELSFAEQVAEFASKRANFLEQPSKG